MGSAPIVSSPLGVVLFAVAGPVLLLVLSAVTTTAATTTTTVGRYVSIMMSLVWFQRLDDAAILVVAVMVLTVLANFLMHHWLPVIVMRCR